MPRFATFLRGMNLGGRRITNDELCEHVRRLGFTDVQAFLASGNVVLTASSSDRDAVTRRLEEGLAAALDYDVPAFVRSTDEIHEIAVQRPFSDRAVGAGKPQVAFLRQPAPARARKAVLALASDEDLLAFAGCELHWLPANGVSKTELDWKQIERHLGTTTVRTHRTIERLANKLL